MDDDIIRYIDSLHPRAAAVAGMLTAWGHGFSGELWTRHQLKLMATATPEPRPSWVEMIANTHVFDIDLQTMAWNDFDYEAKRFNQEADNDSPDPH